MRRSLCVLVACLALSSWAQLSAQEGPSSPTGSPPAASGSGSPPPMLGPLTPSDTRGTLSRASSELESSADRLDRIFSALRGSLARAGISLDSSDGSLESSAISATAAIDSIASLRGDLQAARDLASRRSLEAALWRAAALSAGLGLAGALAEPALGLRALPCAGYAAAGGAAIGIAWGVAELWPRAPR